MNNTSFNFDSFKENRSLIAGYPEGRIIVVTYFSQNAPITDVYTKPADLSMETKDDVHISWTEIRNFEMRCPAEIAFDYDQDSNISKISGEAIVFPMFTPRVGDIFLYPMRNGKIGVFHVGKSNRLALGQETYHQISFTLQEYLTHDRRNQLKRQSGKPWYFDKTKFMVGNTSMLSSEGFIQQKELRHFRSEIIQNYIDRFYSESFSSFMRPDEIYDPYVVEYWNKKVSFQDCLIRPTQLLISVKNFGKTIWAVLTNNPIKDLRNVEKSFSTETYAATFWGVNITSLLGHKFLTVGNETGSVRNPVIDRNGDPILMDTTPIFHIHMSEEERKQLNDTAFDHARHCFYHNFLPHRTCAPHQHPVEHPFPCDPSKCVECSCDDHGHHHPIPKRKPPFPIVSNEELAAIWKRLNKIPQNAPLSESQLAEIRGYILWYRTSYPGTLSRSELEKDWRELASIAPDKELTPEEESGLQDYIRSYRSKFLPVLTDREIEIIWRTHERISYEQQLTDEELKRLEFFIKRYRNNHGDVPNDGSVSETTQIGSPIDPEEIMNQHQLDDDLFTSEEMIAHDHIPSIYYPKHPRPHHHIHCHDKCHELCGGDTCKKPTKPIEDYPTYGLSNEFYLGSVAMDPFERLLYDTITNEEIDPQRVLDAIARYLEWENSDAFYRHLFAIYLIDKSLYWLRFHS